MRAELAAAAATQGGIFTRAQAQAAGYRGPQIRQLTSPEGEWVVVRRGAYAEREYWQMLDPYREQPLAIARAAHLTLQVEHVMSHDSAALAWGLPLVVRTHRLIHITRPGVGGSRTEHGIKHHLADPAEGTFVASGLPVTGIARTALDIAREHGRLSGLAACDKALRLGVAAADFDAVIKTMRSWRHVTRVRDAARAADPGAESPGETLTRDIVVQLGAGTPVTQFPVEVDRGTAWCDMILGCHVFEFDGRRKYRSAEHGGDADGDLEQVIWEEKVRERDVTAHGLGISRVFWADVMPRARQRTLARLKSEYDATCRRLGTTLPPDVAAYAERMWAIRSARIRRDHLGM